VTAANLADRYIADRYLPDKAIDLIDEAGSRLRIRRMSTPPDYKAIEEEIAKARKDKELAIEKQNFEQAKKLREKEEELLQRKATRNRSGGRKASTSSTSSTRRSSPRCWPTGPGSRLQVDRRGDGQAAAHEEELHKRIIGQNDALRAVSQAIRRTRAGLKTPSAPAARSSSWARRVWQDRDGQGPGRVPFRRRVGPGAAGHVRVHGKAHRQPLVGSPPGYVGYEEGGQLTEAVRRKPFSVVLFDEIEKAHPDVFNALLQILEDGRLTDAQGRTVDFKNTVIIMTSNLGTADLRKTSVGFAKADEAVTHEKMRLKVNEALKQHFRPEFLNRIDDVIVSTSSARTRSPRSSTCTCAGCASSWSLRASASS